MKNFALIILSCFITSSIFAQLTTIDEFCPPSPILECVGKEIEKVAATNLVQDDSLAVHRKEINNNSYSVDLAIEEVGALSGKFQLHVDKFPPLVERVGANSDCCAKIDLPKVPITTDVTSAIWNIGNPVTFKYKKRGPQLEIVFTLQQVDIIGIGPFISFEIPAGFKSKDVEYGLAETIYKGNRELIRVFVLKNDNRVFLQRGDFDQANPSGFWEPATNIFIQGSFEFEVL